MNPSTKSGAITGAFCNQYALVSKENKLRYCREHDMRFLSKSYLQHRQIALLLRGTDDILLGDIDKIAESSFLMVVVFALAVLKQRLTPFESEGRKREEY